MGKLMKYELRSAMKLFVPLWIAVLVLAFVNSLMVNPDLEKYTGAIPDFLSNLTMIAYTMTVVAILIVAAVYIVLRFYQATMKDEGYLTFTLPVSIDSILWTKALSGILIMALSMVVAVLSILLLNWRMIDLQVINTILGSTI